VPLLLDALEDKEPAVRQAAADAAKRIVIDAGAKAGQAVAGDPVLRTPGHP
jgi:HEAT repeat protein